MNTTLPKNLQHLANSRLDHLQKTQKENLSAWAENKKLPQALALSDFIYDSLQQDTTLLPWLLSRQSFKPKASSYSAELKALLQSVKSEQALHSKLRQFRRQQMLWLAWQDFHQQIPVAQCLVHLSKLADALVFESYTWLYNQCVNEWGTPCDETGKPQPMLILAMGKLGAHELNFSSDIDLIFTFPENGETQGARRNIANTQFFTRLGQKLIKALDSQTLDGFCYRVDMRLRPFGESGPLVMSFAALEEYYQEQGRDWERYAMVKARVIAKEQFACYQQLRAMLRPFVFRRYIDFSAIESLRRMKTAIQAEVRRRGLEKNIKLGAGGIREIEFIVQSFQLIRGGREPSLRARGLLETLEAIEKLALLTADEVKHLAAAYCFLRRVENLLQAIDDKQSQRLPDDELNQTRLAFAMQKSHWSVLEKEIACHMARVRQIFSALIGDENENETLECYQQLWDSQNLEQTESILIEYQLDNIKEIASSLLQFKQDLTRRSIGQRGREVLQQLMPVLLFKVLNSVDNYHVLERILNLLNQILTRTTYLELLNEHPASIDRLIKLCATSPMVAKKIATFPMLLDELLDPAQLYHPTPVDSYKTALFDYLARIPKQDIEQQMEQIRHFKQTQLLRIAAADISGALPLMKISDHLTFLAEAIIDAVIHQAFEQMVQKYGRPSHLTDEHGYGFAVIAYGKLGGIELSYGSDLDLVFLHDCPENTCTDGEHSIDSWQFYLRLAQRIVHLFSTRTTSGVLYEIDMRLRPSGSSGMLVSTINNFEHYQKNEAWVWEHQALVRTRVVFGNQALRAKIAKLRLAVLSQHRELNELKNEVAAMREKMRTHFGETKHLGGAKQNPNRFHLKQDAGGIVDIEFITQFLVLAYSNSNLKLAHWSDNVRILQTMSESGILSHEQMQALQNAYIMLRDEAHRLALLGEQSFAKSADFTQQRTAVIAIWQRLFA